MTFDLKKGWSHVQATEMKLWHMILAFAVTNVITFCTAQHDKFQSQLSERAQELSTASSTFESSVRNYVTSADTLQKLDEEKLSALKINVDAQIAALNKMRAILRSDEEKRQLKQYLSQLSDLRDIIDDGVQIKDVSRFGQLSQQVYQSRDRILEEISM